MTIFEKRLLGMHLFVRRGTYSHHGLYVGENQVIHYTGDDVASLKGIIRQVDFKDFSYGAEIFVRFYLEPAFMPKKVIERAYQRLGEEEYNLFFNNCEHFASWCVMDRHVSDQVEGWKIPPLGLSRAFGRATLGWAFCVKEKFVDLKMKQFLKNYQLNQYIFDFMRMTF